MTEPRVQIQESVRIRVQRYVRCPVAVTSPTPSPGAEAIGLKPNMVCGERCGVHRIVWGPMEFRCAYGHAFIATWEDVEPPLRAPPTNPADTEVE